MDFEIKQKLGVAFNFDKQDVIDLNWCSEAYSEK